MTQVVYNPSFGGFRLSIPMIKRLRELGVTGASTWEAGCARHDPRLLQVVKEFPNDHELAVTEIHGRLYRIDEYDGKECVQMPHELEWVEVR